MTCLSLPIKSVLTSKRSTSHINLLACSNYTGTVVGSQPDLVKTSNSAWYFSPLSSNDRSLTVQVSNPVSSCGKRVWEHRAGDAMVKAISLRDRHTHLNSTS